MNLLKRIYCYEQIDFKNAKFLLNLVIFSISFAFALDNQLNVNFQNLINYYFVTVAN